MNNDMVTTTVKSKKSAAADNSAIEKFKKKLQKGLGELEKQYNELMASVEKNKLSRAQIHKDGKIIKNRIRRLSGHLDKFTPYAQRQIRFLQKIKEFQSNNEALVSMIAGQLEKMEVPEELDKNDAKTLRSDLIKMLGELDKMKKKREKLLDQIQ